MIIDVYCERNGMGLLAEPLNAISNFSFLIGAWAAWSLAKRTGKLTLEIRTLIALGFSVGIGSILWHTYPVTTTLLLDVVPILIFIIWFIWLYTRTVIGLGNFLATVAAILFLSATFIGMSYGNILHGALSYTPGLLVVLALGVYQAVKRSPERFILFLTAGVYLTALFFRTIDQEVCSSISIGTHFIWHSLIGLVTYLAMRVLIFSCPTEVNSWHRGDVSEKINQVMAQISGKEVQAHD